LVSGANAPILLDGTMTAGTGDILLAATAGSFIYTGTAVLSAASGSWTIYSSLLKYPSYDLAAWFNLPANGGPATSEQGTYPNPPTGGGNVIVYRYIGA
jgi:hypothetical protein